MLSKSNIAKVLVVVTIVWWLHDLWAIGPELRFDDAFMFHRYAMHIRQGLGISWNLDGVHTYGETAPLWGLVVLLFSCLPTVMDRQLMFASAIFGGVGLVTLTWAVRSNAQGILRPWIYALPAVAMPLLTERIFGVNMYTGMETMLGFALCALFIGLILQATENKLPPELAGVAAFLFFLTRPESGVVCFLMAVLAVVWFPLFTVKSAARLLGVYFGLLLIYVLWAKYYFHTFVPLAFYMKAHNAYEGYGVDWYPVTSAAKFLSGGGIFLAASAPFVRRRDWKLIAFMLLPLLAVCIYLSSIVQIMGFYSRYYVPYLPLIVIPALLILDRRSVEQPGQWRQNLSIPVACAAIAVAVFVEQTGYPMEVLVRYLDKVAQGTMYTYTRPVVTIRAQRPLPSPPWGDLIRLLGTDVAAALPRGATIASTEVGIIGGAAPNVNVIDMAGLNDTDIALNGFDPARFLARKPDFIWLPHVDYTYQRGILIMEPQFLQQYDLYDQAMGFGYAIRKDSPLRSLIEAKLAPLWAKFYPGARPEDYLVQSATWDRKRAQIKF